MTNQEIIEKIYRLQLLLKDKNPPIASALEKATIPLLEFEGQLQSAQRSEILSIKGIGEASVGLVARIIAGENPYEIALSVPEPKKKPKWK